MKLLVTGGTVFVSKQTAKYFTEKGHEVYVLNRNHHTQVPGVHLIQCDRNELRDQLKQHHFDAVLDITSYNEHDVKMLLDALGVFEQYVFISSSAVYPESNVQPFEEKQSVGPNSFWGSYGTNKIAAERYLLQRFSQAYIIRPPYLYGSMNNVYREAFVFDCAEQGRPFYLPKEGDMPLHFFDVEDLCRFMEILITQKPKEQIYNVGNQQTVTIREWVTLCYEVVGKTPNFVSVSENVSQRSYFPFLNYAYKLDVSKQKALMPHTKNMRQGLMEAYEWYKVNREAVRRKPLIEFIDTNL